MRALHSVHESAKETVRKVAEVWDKTKIPRVHEVRCVQRLEKVYNEWRNIRKHEKDSPSEKRTMRKEAFKETLDKVFDLSKQNAIDLMEKKKAATNPKEKLVWEEEIAFFKDQSGPRLAIIGEVDAKDRRRVADEVKKDQERKRRAAKRQEEQEELENGRERDSRRRKVRGKAT